MFCVLVDVDVPAGSLPRVRGFFLKTPSPNRKKVMLTNISIKGQVVYPHKHGSM